MITPESIKAKANFELVKKSGVDFGLAEFLNILSELQVTQAEVEGMKNTGLISPSDVGGAKHQYVYGATEVHQAFLAKKGKMEYSSKYKKKFSWRDISSKMREWQRNGDLFFGDPAGQLVINALFSQA